MSGGVSMGEEVEQWRPWPRDAWYEVSNLGRVRSGPSRKVLAQKTDVSQGRKPQIETRCGRWKVCAMVWQAWRGESPYQVDNIDGDVTNNRLSNLRPSGAVCPKEAAWDMSKIGRDDVASVVSRYASGEKVGAIAGDLGCSAPAIYAALRRAGVCVKEARGQRRESARAMTTERKAAVGRTVVGMRETGMSLAECAKALGLSLAWVSRCLAAVGQNGWGLTRRISEAQGKRATQEQASSLGLTVKQADEKARNLLKNYGLTLVEYIAIKERQSNKCKACGGPLGEERTAENAKRIGSRFPVVDHCHRTADRRGAVRGVLHSACNTALGMAREDREVLRRWIRYLDATATTRPMDAAAVPQGALGL